MSMTSSAGANASSSLYDWQEKPAATAGQTAGVLNAFLLFLESLAHAKWTSPEWWSTFLGELTSLAAFVIGVFHPGFELPTLLQVILPSAAVLAVAAVTIGKQIARSRVHTATIQATSQLHMQVQAIAHEREHDQMQLQLALAAQKLDPVKTAPAAPKRQAQKAAAKPRKPTTKPAPATS